MSVRRPLPRATELAHLLVRERLQDGDTVIDATVGNGHDTLFLADLVGPAGKVIGFDIQEDAIEATRTRTGNCSHVTLHQTGHENMGEFVEEGVAAIMFNLGYLPSGDKTVTTRPETTTRALEVALRLLLPGGIVTLAVYTGHEGGQPEADALTEILPHLPQEEFSVVTYRFLNQRNSPPHLIAIQKKES